MLLPKIPFLFFIVLEGTYYRWFSGVCITVTIVVLFGLSHRFIPSGLVSILPEFRCLFFCCGRKEEELSFPLLLSPPVILQFPI